MHKLATWKLIVQSLNREIPVMLLYVLESIGSSPGRGGFFMAVNAVGEMEGSIGGGMMEHKLVELAKGLLKEPIYSLSSGQVKKQIHDKSASRNQSGMICSGEQTVWIGSLSLQEKAVVEKIIANLEGNKKGMLHLSPAGIRFSEEVNEAEYFDLRSETDWDYKEKIGFSNQLYIIGGGHCSLALSRLMQSMDFYVHVYDDRKDLPTMRKNFFAQEKTILGSYDELSEHVPSGENHYVVIMSFGYRTDEIALRALLDKEFAYLGLLGSSNKIEKMFEEMKASGIAKEQLGRIYTPVGIPINSQTPEEIAVSIAAQIIQVKNRR